MNKDFYTTGEVAKILGISKQWVSTLAREGKLDSYRIQDGGWHRITKASLERYISENRIPVEVPS